MKNGNIGAFSARPKINNKIKIIIGVTIILLLLVTMLIFNKTKVLKTQEIASNEYVVTINKTTLDISNLITAEPNLPVLSAGMIPIKWNEQDKVWQIADKNDWYDYKAGIPATVMLSDRILQI